MNDDVRSPGSGSTPGPLSQQPPHGLDTDPGKFHFTIMLLFSYYDRASMQTSLNDVTLNRK